MRGDGFLIPVGAWLVMAFWSLRTMLLGRLDGLLDSSAITELAEGTRTTWFNAHLPIRSAATWTGQALGKVLIADSSNAGKLADSSLSRIQPLLTAVCAVLCRLCTGRVVLRGR
ncbi:hypothetical protein D9M69_496400 [compost metagenome]